MTIIEFFDTNAIHNILSTLLLSPKRVVLLGEDEAALRAFLPRMQKILAERRLETKVKIMPIPEKGYAYLVNRIETLLKDYTDCVFDLTGGDTEMLVAMGALSQKYNIPMHISDPMSCTLRPLTDASAYPPLAKLTLSIRECACLYGGKVTEAFLPPPHDGFWEDVLKVWSVARQDPVAWNVAMSALHTLSSPDSLSACISVSELKRRLSPSKAATLRRALGSLADAGCFLDYFADARTISFRLRSAAFQTAMEKEGSVLELYTYYISRICSPWKGEFSDGACGVVFDWDTLPPRVQRDDVRNEIDVCLMHGITPIFISCKNGFVDTDELYKLSVVASRFGGGYGKAAVVLTGHRPDASFFARAKELGIHVLPSVHTLPPEVFCSVLKNALL